MTEPSAQEPSAPLSIIEELRNRLDAIEARFLAAFLGYAIEGRYQGKKLYSMLAAGYRYNPPSETSTQGRVTSLPTAMLDTVKPEDLDQLAKEYNANNGAVALCTAGTRIIDRAKVPIRAYLIATGHADSYLVDKLISMLDAKRVARFQGVPVGKDDDAVTQRWAFDRLQGLLGLIPSKPSANAGVEKRSAEQIGSDVFKRIKPTLE